MPHLKRVRHQANCGFSLVELMVGIAIGMIVVAGASVMMTNQLAEHRRLTLETQVQQDLRAAADLMLRDLRRAGSWAAPQNGVWSPGAAAAPVANAYAATSLTTDSGSSVLEYSYSRHKDRNRSTSVAIADPEDNLMSSSTEKFGFKIEDGGILKFRIGDRWQPLTDVNVLVITAFDVDLSEQQIILEDLCSTACPASSTTCPPKQSLRRIDISLTGHAFHDSRVERTIKLTSRVRNDQLIGACP
ncbi:PilW family protein [Roseateles albus]|uniref:Prepilin-type N-terminal cleavage/methylation domain-containing protein n=1 Tax=Roseateles albus TaxID=2987525 RepID=A0ABT5KHJ7_9BURK|nr:prepilin-type N-terminal cleavage/methylation domain-containing protein [Roseateles albus]MDC8772934.1 prepilin-type N-terminal cleavage/methylation domain-containing protein [Roseateles albus]